MAAIKYDSKSNEFYNSNSNEVSTLPQIIWHITDRCFLSCPYCFATKTGKETSLDKLNDFMEAFKELGVQKVDIAGGDPLTYSNLDVICNELSKLGIQMTITTSGVGKNDVKEWLIDHAEMFSWILISIDAPTSTQHDSLRRKVGTFDQLTNLIEMLKKKQYRNIRINTVITKIFLEHDLIEQFVDLIQELQPLEWCLIQPHPANKKEKYDEYATNDQEYEGIVTNIKNKMLEKNCSNVNVTLRYNHNYSKYWVLYPSGKLKMHTENSEDRFDFDFNCENVDDIKKYVNEYGVWVPMKKEE
ncbi:radical SAM protein [Lysinibacillus fusiformis]|uniref:4Fe-4S single cluster domain-containing protein n=1 Tax=Lysinibacillus fusiformis TaxID=28031 RepID=A0A1H9JKY6_9BACI|nr:radical SAM protein [Lysinibacillus fusiformis]SCY42959.1 4Fe-4S single cluster domain-containing protein [Lysinibacillus fusiformis]SEN75310.1 4Fe-4S single cluster domain-containing protein [Lysinibacillus fusiformis]SEQ87459.1 4Fe-4S single cluster domain-containing protein [Lysinibacillus fusiformis]